MSGSGNMIPQSISRMRSSTSTQAQLRPISPRPPKKTTRTGLVTVGESSRPPRRDGRVWGRGPMLRRRTGLGPRPGRRSRQRQAVAGVSPLRDLQFLRRVLPVLELDDAELGEALAEPAVGGVEQAELAAVRDNLGEQHRLEHVALGSLQ